MYEPQMLVTPGEWALMVSAGAGVVVALLWLTIVIYVVKGAWKEELRDD